MIFGRNGYGKEITKRIYPDGSVESSEASIRNGKVVSTKVTYQHQVKVRTEEDVLAQFIKFRQDHIRDGISFSFRSSPSGSQYIVKTWEK